MSDVTIVATVVVHTIYASIRRATPDGPSPVRDRGAVSLEQVLWFVAAGVGVAVIAAILWGQIRDTANTPIDTPTAP
jgi:hypothetical protein